MKKLMICAAFVAAMCAFSTVNAQEVKKETKKECCTKKAECKKDKKECTKDTKDCTKKADCKKDGKACCKKETPKKK